jgi:hypothetical protein
MRQIRIERKPRRERDDRSSPPSLDPRDPDVVRAKRLAAIGAQPKARA